MLYPMYIHKYLLGYHTFCCLSSTFTQIFQLTLMQSSAIITSCSTSGDDMQVKRIETYSLYEFCKEVQEAVLSGWRFDFDSNDNFPTAFGSMVVAGMLKAEPKIDSPQTLVTEESTEVAKRGRKPKE